MTSGPNPLLQLISSVERPANLATSSNNSTFTQSYSLFSPSAWPGPLLSSPSVGPAARSPGPGNLGDNNVPMFGAGVGGPSPLERLLHQVGCHLELRKFFFKTYNQLCIGG